MKNEKNGIQLNIAQSRLFINFGIKERSDLRYECTSRWHSNKQCEVTMVLEGGCRVELEEGSVDLRAGQAVVIPRDRYHSFTAEPGSFERFCFWFELSGGPLERQLDKVEQARVFDVEPELMELCRTIYREYRLRTPFWWDMQTAMLKMLAVSVLRWLKLDDSENAAQGFKDRPLRATRIERYIEANLSQEPTLEGLAASLHLSRRQIMRIVQEEFGMTFRDKVLKTRMERAAWLLRTGELPLDIVVGEVGYATERGFYQSFRRYFGLTPRQYRRKMTAAEPERRPKKEP